MSVGPYCDLVQDVDSTNWTQGAVVSLSMDENERECKNYKKVMVVVWGGALIGEKIPSQQLIMGEGISSVKGGNLVINLKEYVSHISGI